MFKTGRANLATAERCLEAADRINNISRVSTSMTMLTLYRDTIFLPGDDRLAYLADNQLIIGRLFCLLR